jgi:glycosyltransferase involved in cell wall biosynthesis
VPDRTLCALYSSAQAFCYPSLQEGFGLPVLEAMSCGAPVVTSNTTALAEIAAGAAVLVNPERTDEIASALQGLAASAERRAMLREAGFRRAREYRWDRTATKLAAVYREVSGRR